MLISPYAPFGALVILALSGPLSSPALAGSFDGRPKILLHSTLATVKNPCTHGNDILTDCNNVATAADVTGPNVGYFVYLVAARGNLPDIESFICGITYQGGAAGAIQDGVGIDMFGWVRCSGSDLPALGWPAPGSFNLVIFDDEPDVCRTTDAAVAGYFYVAAYTPDVLQVAGRPQDGLAAIAQCTPSHIEHELQPNELGSVAFTHGAVVDGCNPCLELCGAIIPGVAATWGRLKSLYAE